MRLWPDSSDGRPPSALVGDRDLHAEKERLEAALAKTGEDAALLDLLKESSG